MKLRKLTDEQVFQIKELGRTDMKRVEIARRFGVSPQLVSTVIRYGYDRPKYEAPEKPVDPNSRKCWDAIASEYSTMYPDDPLTPDEAKKIHDTALSKLRHHFRNIEAARKELI